MIYEFGEFRLDVEEEILTDQNGNPVKLEPKPLKILIFLVKNNGKYFNSDELVEKIWGPRIFVEPHNVTTHISTIRHVLKDDKKQPQFIIKTNKGYSFLKNAVREDKDDTVKDDVQVISDIFTSDDKSTNTSARTPILTGLSFQNVSKESTSEYQDVNKHEHQKAELEEEANFSIDLKTISATTIKFVLILIAISLIIHLVVTYSVSRGEIEANSNDLIISLIQFGGLLIFYILLISPIGLPQKLEDGWTKLASAAFQQFLEGWALVWITWILLYSYITAALLFRHFTTFIVYNVAIQVTVDFLNIVNSFVFFYLFLVLDIPSVTTDKNPNRNESFYKKLKIIGVICLIIFGFSSVCRFIANENTNSSYIIGTYISGMLVAVAMSYFAGRLDSHYMKVPRSMLAPLYCYAIIQLVGPGLVNYASEPESLVKYFKPAFFVAAIFLKIYLFFIMYYWLHNGAFANYFKSGTENVEKNS